MNIVLIFCFLKGLGISDEIAYLVFSITSTGDQKHQLCKANQQPHSAPPGNLNSEENEF